MIVIDFSKCIYWADHTKISFLQRRVIVHSIIYYELNDSCISDSQFDELSMQLVKMQSECDYDELRNSMYFYAMHDFDGSTGFHIIKRLTGFDLCMLTNIAKYVLRCFKGEIK